MKKVPGQTTREEHRRRNEKTEGENRDLRRNTEQEQEETNAEEGNRRMEDTNQQERNYTHQRITQTDDEEEEDINQHTSDEETRTQGSEITEGTDRETGTETDESTTEDEEEERRQEKQERRWRMRYGDSRTSKNRVGAQNTVRIGTFNIGTLPDPGTVQSLRLQQEIKQFACIGLSELNKNWYKVNSRESFRTRVNTWWKIHKTNFTWLREFQWPSTHQFGGVSLTTINQLSNYVQEKGEDKSGLGRWVWHVLEGHSEIKTTVIQIYRPIKNQEAEGSVYFQQQAAGNMEDPLNTFDSDLMELIDQQIEQGFQCIVMGDFNLPLNKRSQIEQQLQQRGIREVIQERYGTTSPPSTHRRGSHPIDGIFASETIHIDKGGYDGGHEDISDHRLLWADFTLDSILGEDRGDITRPKGKRLQLTSKKTTKKFNKLFRKQIRIHDLRRRAMQLQKDIGQRTEMTEKEKKEHLAIHEQRKRATEYAEKRCSKQPSSDDPFSMELKQAMGKASIFQGMYKRIKMKRRIHARWIIDNKKKFGITEHIDIIETEKEAKEKSKNAYKEFRKKQSKSAELRTQYLDHLIEQAEQTGDEKKRKEIKAIKEKEQMKDVHQRIKLARGKLRSGGVRFIHKQDDNGLTETIKDKFLMEQEIRHANEAKLQMANESPVRQGELGQLLTDHDYSRWEELLQGNIQLPEAMEEGTKRWLEKFDGINIEEHNMQITAEDYKNSWKVVKEHTSSLPGKEYYGTFKAMRWCQEAAELHTALANIPIQTGHTPQAWRHSVDSMLPKKEGEWRPHKLRLTSLMHPEFNHNNKILGRAAMQLAERKKMLALEQYGSRKGLSASKHALNKRLLLDILRIQRRPGVLCANDAKACYDRILHIAAYLSMRRIGLKKEAVQSMLEPIRTMFHQIRTAYGDSMFSYGGCDWERDPSGICQGNGAGPAIWAIVSSPLLEILREAGYGAKLHASIGDCFLHLSGFAFVDDADTIQAGRPGDSTETVLGEAQKQLDLWEEAIRATGGGIEGEKSDFVIINYKWRSGKWSYEKKSDQNSMTVHNPIGPREALTQLDPSEARRTLGVWQAADGNEEKQTEKMIEKAENWARAVARSTLGRSDTVTGLRTTLYPSVTFGAMATTLTQQQCQEVFKPIRKGALSKSGYMKTIPAVILHAPEKFGGIGLMDFYTVQGIEHVKVLADEGGTESPTGKLINILLHDHVLELGRSGYFLDQDYDKVQSLLTDSWLKHTLKFLSENQITIEHKQQHMHRWRRHDTFIMDDIMQAQGVDITNEELEATNRCRIYLRAATRSDITTGDGTMIIDAAWRCINHFDTISEHVYKWPFQPRPSRQDISAWQGVLTKVYGVGNRIKRWQQPMGVWNKRSAGHTQWMYDEASDSLYQRKEQEWTRWRRMSRRTRANQFTICTGETEPKHPRWKLAKVLHMPVSTIVVGLGSGYIGTQRRERIVMTDQGERVTRRTPRALAQAIRNMPSSLQWLFETIKFPIDNGRSIAKQIIRGTAKCVSDGSCKNNLGTSAATFVEEEEDRGYMISNRVPGTDQVQHSYRSELCGILTNVIFLNAIAETHGIENGMVEIGCDNESAIWGGFNGIDATCGDDSFDILRVLKHAVRTSPIQWKPRHVKGHQDRHVDMAELDEWATGNVLCDKQAEEHWNRKYSDGSREKPEPPTMPGEGWRITLGDTTIVQKISQNIHEHISYTPVMKYWEKKKRFTQGMGDFIDWEKYGKALKGMPFGKKQWVRKHYCGFEATNWMLHKCKRRKQPYCPKCEKLETHRHITRCQSNSATQKFRDVRRAFADWLQQTTSPGMKDAILAHVQAYRNEENVVEGDNWSDELITASRLQEALGECAFTEGCLDDSWEKIQAIHLQTMNSKRKPGRWTTELIKKLWTISWDMWDHRNGWIHQETETRKEQIEAHLDSEIERLHQLGNANRFMPDIDRRFFRKPIQRIKEKTENGKRIWIHMAQRFITYDRLRVATSQETRTIREYLQPGSTEEIRRHSRGILNRHQRDFQAPSGTRRDPVSS